MKTIRIFLAFLLTLTTLTMSRPSHAVVGLATGNPVVTILGAASLGGAGIYMAAGANDTIGESFVRAFFGLIVGAVGLTLLDGEQAYEFAEISSSEARSLGVSAEEREAFNLELDQVNAIAEAVATELPEKASVEEAKALWAQYGEMLHPQALSATIKISRTMAKKQ